MSKTSSDSKFDPKVWIVPGIVTGVLAAAVVTYPRAAEINAAPGSPYYSKAAGEALAGLRNPDEKQALPAAAPALPAGLSPDEHYWCEQCKAYHKRQPQGAPQAAAAPAVAVPSAAIPALPEGLDPAEYYWCANCKVYHSHKDPKVGVPGVEPTQPSAPGVPQNLARPIEPPPSQE
jgi:hypothetical protein